MKKLLILLCFVASMSLAFDPVAMLPILGDLQSNRPDLFKPSHVSVNGFYALRLRIVYKATWEDIFWTATWCGIAKELLDAASGGHADWTDMWGNWGGVALAYAVEVDYVELLRPLFNWDDHAADI